MMWKMLAILLTWTFLLASETATIEPELTCYTFEGRNYRGTVARTVSGKTCQSWSAQTPHQHGTTPDDYPHEGLDKNYCRNPVSVEKMPWCYTTDSETRWELCSVPRCEPRPETHQKVLKLKVSPDDPTVDLHDPAVMEDILKQLEEKLKQRGMSGDVELTWKKQPDGKVFQEEIGKRRDKTEP